ncbi:MAG TPA: hypothetical protein VMX77_00105 [Candidatus Bathyarchaeia archaeon]|nr:hypothetical protein [Candidatus Bathyarchaeia archaeon]
MPEEVNVQPVEVKTEEEPLVREIEKDKKANLKEILFPVGVILVIIIAGVFTGNLLANRRGGLPVGPTETKELEEGVEMISGPKEVGIKDVRVFRDSAEGKIEINDGSITTEGSHKLVRPGGESQIAYLTSSVVDLNLFIGKCVQVWGETFKAEKAGWLMDIGRVKLLDKCPSGI